MNEPSLYTITLSLPAGLSDVQASLFADEAFGGEQISSSLVRQNPASQGEVSQTGWTIQWLLSGTADMNTLCVQLNNMAQICGLDIPTIQHDDIICTDIDPDTNWLEQSYRGFPPFNVGGFYIHGSHSTQTPPAGQRVLQIDAATAFGSGEHGTTAGCLLLLEQLKQDGIRPRRILDMGCGSGILGIAAWMLFNAPVIASDIDPESVRVTNDHGRINNIPVWDERDTTTGMATCDADGFASRLVKTHAPYDIVIANILPAPLLAMADDLVNATADQGYVILSGILNEQADNVRAAYQAIGLRPINDIVRGDWTSLLMQK